MKNITLCLVSSILSSQFLYCQQYPRSALRTTGYYGYSIGEKSDIKKIMLSSGFALSVEKKIGTTLYINLGVDISSLKFSYYDSGFNSIFSTNYSLLFPVSLKKYYKVGRKSDLFWDFGLAPAYYFYSKEINNKDISATKRNIGIKIGGVGKLGFKTQMTNTIYFDVGLNSYQDYVVLYKAKENRLTSKSNSLMFSFYFKL